MTLGDEVDSTGGRSVRLADAYELLARIEGSMNEFRAALNDLDTAVNTLPVEPEDRSSRGRLPFSPRSHSLASIRSSQQQQRRVAAHWKSIKAMRCSASDVPSFALPLKAWPAASFEEIRSRVLVCRNSNHQW